MRTTAPGRHVVLYDGQCRFCVASVARLTAWTPPGAVEAADVSRPGALDRFPGLTAEACLRRVHLVLPDGRVVAGCAALVEAAATRAFPGRLARVYYLPGLRSLCDWLYDVVAANRYRILGRTGPACRDGLCSLPAATGRQAPAP